MGCFYKRREATYDAGHLPHNTPSHLTSADLQTSKLSQSNAILT
jgi:hypothetical protein